ncbi:uncharacterized protein LOC133294744 [Gastrolobium bilobum]|uniref:uncharacterized protein LOC133294744 n=1 Tax=Gastrolobium bilobum TaxID=150636 RepID=UPI002AAF1C09|nr:uncharacterized protein LOC133294744 [Gastrolobium bilobum]
MGEYGYTYQGYSTFNTVRGETRRPVIKPFVPSIPNTNNNSEGNVTKKIIVPVGSSRPYGDDDYNKHSPQTEAYPIRNDNYAGYYNGTNGYGDYGSNKEGRNPIGGTIRNDNHDGYYNGTNDGYGDYGNYGNKEGRKPIGSTIRNDNYGGYNGPNGYGEYNNKEGRKPFGSTLRNENYGDNDYGDYNYKEVQRPKYSSGWTAAPRKGTQLSEPTHDIGKTIELLKKAAKETSNNNNNEHSNKGGHKATGNVSWLGESTNKVEKGMELVKEAERLKNIVTGPPLRYADYRDASIIDPRNAEKIFKGKKV